MRNLVLMIRLCCILLHFSGLIPYTLYFFIAFLLIVTTLKSLKCQLVWCC